MGSASITPKRTRNHEPELPTRDTFWRPMTIAHNLGFPAIGALRELKLATEAYWSGKVSPADLLKTGAELRARHWRLQQDAGLDLVPCNDFSFYDRVLDACALVGAVPARYANRPRADQVDWTPTSRWPAAAR